MSCRLLALCGRMMGSWDRRIRLRLMLLLLRLLLAMKVRPAAVNRLKPMYWGDHWFPGHTSRVAKAQTTTTGQRCCHSGSAETTRLRSFINPKMHLLSQPPLLLKCCTLLNSRTTQIRHLQSSNIWHRLVVVDRLSVNLIRLSRNHMLTYFDWSTNKV